MNNDIVLITDYHVDKRIDIRLLVVINIAVYKQEPVNVIEDCCRIF